MLARVSETIARYRMCNSGQRIGVACSGGPDSVALLEALRVLASDLGVTLGLVHLNHGLRGVASEADEQFVRDLGAKHGLDVHVASADLARGNNLEEAGRDARYAWFAKLVEQGVFDRIATGHTRSDQAETVLFRLLRGSGPDGLSAIRAVRAPGVIRPLLFVAREDVAVFLSERGIEYRVDESNRDRRFARNRIRLDLLPQLRGEWNPRVSEALSRLGEQAAEDAAYWEARLERWEARLLRPAPDGLAFQIAALVRLEPALRRRILRRALERIGGAGRHDFQHVDALRRLVEQPSSGARLSLPGVTAERSCGKVRLSTGASAACEPVWIAPPGERQAPDGRTRIRIVPEAQDAAFGSYTKPSWDRIDGTKAPNPLVLRSWRPGDRFRVHLDNEPRKLNELLQSAAVPSWDRALWPVLVWAPNGDVADDRIVWTRGYGVSSEFRPSGNIGEALRVFEFDEGGRAWTGLESWEAISAGL